MKASGSNWVRPRECSVWLLNDHLVRGKETEKEEDSLNKSSTKARKAIEERLIVAYDRLRGNSKNGLAVVSIERESCGGCFNKIPPQRQLDIKARKKIIVCEHCGRILVEPPEEERKKMEEAAALKAEAEAKRAEELKAKAEAAAAEQKEKAEAAAAAVAAEKAEEADEAPAEDTPEESKED